MKKPMRKDGLRMEKHRQKASLSKQQLQSTFFQEEKIKSNNNSDRWDHRYHSLLEICEKFLEANELGGLISIDYDILSKAIYKVYPEELDKVKKKLNLTVLDRHKVSSLTTLVVYQANPLKISNKKTNNAFCEVALELFSIYIGISNLAKPDELFQQRESELATLIGILRNENPGITTISLTYFQLEDRYLQEKERSSIQI